MLAALPAECVAVYRNRDEQRDWGGNLCESQRVETMLTIRRVEGPLPIGGPSSPAADSGGYGVPTSAGRRAREVRKLEGSVPGPGPEGSVSSRQ